MDRLYSPDRSAGHRPAGGFRRSGDPLLHHLAQTSHLVYVQVYDIRCNPPYEVLDRFRVWVTWDKETKCYDIGNIGVYTLKFYKYKYDKTPMIISGNAASFKIRYMLCPPWI